MATGDVLTYQGFDAAKKAFGRSPIPEWRMQENRSSQLTLKDGNRYYNANGKWLPAYDKNFAILRVPSGEQFPLLQPGQKPAVGQQWSFVRSGSGVCGAWSVKYTASIKDGPDVKIAIKGVETTVKTLLIEHRGTSTLHGAGCDPNTQERNVLYSPELGELVADQWLTFVRGDVEDGYKWSLITVK